MKEWKKRFYLLLGFALLVALIAGGSWLIRAIWLQFASLPATTAVAIVTGASTVLVSTLTVVLGRYFERKKELDALYRDKKVEIYNEFLKEFFNVFQGSSTQKQKNAPADALAQYLKEWQRKLLLWAGPEVIESYSQWMTALRNQPPVKASAFFQTEKLLLAIRTDLGHSNRGIQRGIFIRFFAKNADMILAALKNNPDATMDELIAMEKSIEEAKAKLQLQQNPST